MVQAARHQLEVHPHCKTNPGKGGFSEIFSNLSHRSKFFDLVDQRVSMLPAGIDSAALASEIETMSGTLGNKPFIFFIDEVHELAGGVGLPSLGHAMANLLDYKSTVAHLMIIASTLSHLDLLAPDPRAASGNSSRSLRYIPRSSSLPQPVTFTPWNCFLSSRFDAVGGTPTIKQMRGAAFWSPCASLGADVGRNLAESCLQMGLIGTPTQSL